MLLTVIITTSTYCYCLSRVFEYSASAKDTIVRGKAENCNMFSCKKIYLSNTWKLVFTLCAKKLVIKDSL